MARRTATTPYPEPTLKPFTIEFEFDDPDDVDHVLQGLIVARSNNSNPLFEDFIDAINAEMQTYRTERLKWEQAGK